MVHESFDPQHEQEIYVEDVLLLPLVVSRIKCNLFDNCCFTNKIYCYLSLLTLGCES